PRRRCSPIFFAECQATFHVSVEASARRVRRRTASTSVTRRAYAPTLTSLAPRRSPGDELSRRRAVVQARLRRPSYQRVLLLVQDIMNRGGNRLLILQLAL